MKKNPLFVLFFLFLFSFSYKYYAADIHDLIKAGDVAKVSAMLEKNPHAKDSRDEAGCTPLHWAALGKNIEIIRILLEKGADANALDNNGIAALHSLASRGNSEGARLLLAKGGQVDIALPNHETPLHLAAVNKHMEMIGLLLENKANLEQQDDYGRTPLLVAVREMAGVEVVRQLLAARANIEAADRFGDNALMLAAWRGSGDVVDLLLERQAAIPADAGKLAQLLQFSAEQALPKLFSRLAASGADTKAVSANGQTLLHAAATGGATVIIDTLLAQGLNVNQCDGNGWTPLHFAVDLGRLPAIELLLTRGADLKARTVMGQSAANIAQDNADPLTLALLTRKGLVASAANFPTLRGPYLGQKTPGRKAEIFAPGIVSGHYGLHSTIVFAPDGQEAFWSVMLPERGGEYSQDRTLCSRLVNGCWTYPTTAVMAGVKLSDVPFFHPAGGALFDMSGRPAQARGEGGKENIWQWSRDKVGWRAPKLLPPVINHMPLHWQFSVDRQSNLYFSTTIPGSLGGSDIYVCRFSNGQYQPAENLGPQINTQAGESFPFIYPDGNTLLFERNLNIYVSFRDGQDHWTKAKPLGPEVNTPGMEILPIVSPDGRYLFFCRNQQTYWIDAAVIEDIHQIEISRFGKKSAAIELEALLAGSDMEPVKKRLAAIQGAEAALFYCDESELNQLGYRLLQQRQQAAALAIFAFTAQVFPSSWNAWDSLGESYLYGGQPDQAEECYAKSLALNPASQSGQINLQRLRSERLGHELDAQKEIKAAIRYKPGAQTKLKGAYLGQNPPGNTPVVFAPGIVSSAGAFEFSIAFSPAGKEVFFTRRMQGGQNMLLVSRLLPSGWTAPAPAEFAKGYPSCEPHITADGKKLYFGSTRPRVQGAQAEDGIWVVAKMANGAWGEPAWHGPGMYVSSARNGNLYMTDVTGIVNQNGEVIMYPWNKDRFGQPVRLDGGVNSPTPANHACIAADESYIVFDSSFRPGGQGGEGDLYVAFRQANGAWGEAINLGDTINSAGTNFCPLITPDGKYLFYSSHRDIYWVSTDIISRLRAK